VNPPPKDNDTLIYVPLQHRETPRWGCSSGVERPLRMRKVRDSNSLCSKIHEFWPSLLQIRHFLPIVKPGTSASSMSACTCHRPSGDQHVCRYAHAASCGTVRHPRLGPCQLGLKPASQRRRRICAKHAGAPSCAVLQHDAQSSVTRLWGQLMRAQCLVCAIPVASTQRLYHECEGTKQRVFHRSLT
jgi:hypothetical protein